MSAGHITEGKWNQIKGSVKERWGELTDDEYKQSEGKVDQLAGKIEEKYGHARRDVAEQLDKLTDDNDSRFQLQLASPSQAHPNSLLCRQPRQSD